MIDPERPRHELLISAAGDTDIGRRPHNEDAVLLRPNLGLFVLADGAGGHNAGNVASALATTSVAHFYERTQAAAATWPDFDGVGLHTGARRLATAIQRANQEIVEIARSSAQKKGMGTTVVAMHFDDEAITIAHVGDSRCYRFRQGELKQATEDHSLLNDYKRMAVLTPEEEANFPHKNIIVRACGLKDNVLVDLQREIPLPGDIYILCSDGLSGEVTDAQICDIMVQENQDLVAMVARLIRTACENGGKDNVTCIAARVEEV